MIASNNKTQIKSDLITISVEPNHTNILPPSYVPDPNENNSEGNIELDNNIISPQDEKGKERQIIKPPKQKRTLLYVSVIALVLALIALYYLKKSDDNQNETIIPKATIDSVATYIPEPTVVDSADSTAVNVDTMASLNPVVKKIPPKIKAPKKTVVTTMVVEEEIEEEEEKEEQKQPNYPQKETARPKASGIDLNDIKDKIAFVPVRGGLLNLGKVKGYVLINNSNFDIKQIKIEVINANNNEAKSFVFENIKHQSKSLPQNVGDDFKPFTSKKGKAFTLVSVD